MDVNKFPDALKKKLEDLCIRPSELARRTGISKQNISRIINQAPHPITGAPAKTTEDVVLKIAKALEWDASEALMMAGYAPVDLPSNYEREVAALFRNSPNWSVNKKQHVYKQVRGLIEMVETEDE